MRFVRLIGKTLKGRSKLNDAGKPDHWVIIEERSMIGFSDRPGPWIHVRPDNNNTDKSRWVNLHNDFDFEVEVIR